MTFYQWDRWLRECFVMRSGVSQTRIDILKKTRRSLSSELARVEIANREDADTLSSADGFIDDIWDLVEDSFRSCEEFDVEASTLRALYAERLSKMDAYPLGPLVVDEVLGWCSDTLRHHEVQRFNGSAVVIMHDDTEHVMFKLRWADELQLK